MPWLRARSTQRAAASDDHQPAASLPTLDEAILFVRKNLFVSQNSNKRRRATTMNEPNSSCENGDPDPQIWRKELHSRLSRYRSRRGRRIEGQFSMRFSLPADEESAAYTGPATDPPETDIAGATLYVEAHADEPPETPAALAAAPEAGQGESAPEAGGAMEITRDEPAVLANVVTLTEDAEIDPPPPVNVGAASLVPVADAAAVRAFCSEAIEALTPECAEPGLEAAGAPPLVEQPPRPQLVPRPVGRRKVIAFPKPALPPIEITNQLADPVVPEAPRILDVPEELQSVATRPFLDGLDLDSATKEARPPAEHVELPFPAASIGQRTLANAVDLAMVALGAALSSLVVHLTQPALPRDKFLLIAALSAGVVLWCIYEYMFLVFGGRTTGTQAAKLRLINFKGVSVKMPRRRLRTMSMFLSTASLAMGFLWAFVDVDGLCWHDRISQTYWARK